MTRRALPEPLCFPALPAALAGATRDSPALAAEIALFLGRVEAWRQGVLHWIGEPNLQANRDVDGLTHRACQALATFLQTAWSLNMWMYAEQSPYNIAHFPIREDTEEAAKDPVHDLLCWRAAVVDYLSDIWDVLGEPELTTDECSAMHAFLRPTPSNGLCDLCLRSLPEARRHTDRHTCPVLGHIRAKWPSLDAPEDAQDLDQRRGSGRRTSRKRGRSVPRKRPEARPAEPAAAPNPPRRKWWQFWR